jgi:hypothetical protein
MDEKRAPQPASEDGKAMEYLVNKERSCVSIKMSKNVAMAALLEPPLDVVVLADADAHLAVDAILW